MVHDPTSRSPNGASLRGEPLTVCGLFAGIGGIEEGLRRAGHHIHALCEIDEAARKVLGVHFSKARLEPDVSLLGTLPRVDLVSAGFPCQDLSQAGKTNGIEGGKSGVVHELFRLVRSSRYKPKWILLENVPFMLRLDRGRAMQFLTQHLESLGYRWAYRTIDTRAFGLPQRRLRVLLLASRTEDPRQALFSDDAGEETAKKNDSSAYGFYWTEGNRGLGWAWEAVPTLKGGSGCGIPSPPGIWVTGSRSIITPDVRDAERLQGFPADWTKPAEEVSQGKRGARWRLVGNAVTVHVSAWLGERLMSPGRFDESSSVLITGEDPWPPACWGDAGKRHAVTISSWPVRKPAKKLLDFLKYPTVPLSARATSGFLCRARASSLSFVDGFLDDVAHHLRQMDPRGQFPDRFTNGRARK